MATPECKICHELIPEIDPVAEKWRDSAQILVVDRVSVENQDHPPRVSAHSIWIHAIDQGGRVHSAFDVQATPFAFILDREGRVVRKGIVNYGHSLDRMIQAAVDTRQKQVSRYADSTDESR
jgi:thiol-disulfide isomerase/thioredoxin